MNTDRGTPSTRVLLVIFRLFSWKLVCLLLGTKEKKIVLISSSVRSSFFTFPFYSVDVCTCFTCSFFLHLISVPFLSFVLLVCFSFIFWFLVLPCFPVFPLFLLHLPPSPLPLFTFTFLVSVSCYLICFCC